MRLREFSFAACSGLQATPEPQAAQYPWAASSAPGLRLSAFRGLLPGPFGPLVRRRFQQDLTRFPRRRFQPRGSSGAHVSLATSLSIAFVPVAGRRAQVCTQPLSDSGPNSAPWQPLSTPPGSFVISLQVRPDFPRAFSVPVTAGILFTDPASTKAILLWLRQQYRS